ncbi:hypothetical protein ES703_57001 [subsurface metagenome]
MRKLKRVLGVLLLTVLLVAITAVDDVLLTNGSPDSQLTAPELECAAVGQCVEVKFLKAQYDSEGTFIGCWGKGYSCAVVVVSVAGQERQLSIAAGGVLLR